MRPDLLRHKGNKRVQQPAGLIQHIAKHRAAALPCLLVAQVAIQHRLRELEVPVTQLMPGELIHRLRRAADVEGLQARLHLRRRMMQPRHNPLVGSRQTRRREVHGPSVKPLKVHQRKPRRIPQLVNEGLVSLHPLHIELDVATGRRIGRQREPQRVRALRRNTLGIVSEEKLVGLLILGRQLAELHAIDDVQWVDDIALRLRHLLPSLVPHHGVQKDRGEGRLSHEVKPHENHARHPEEDDVEPRLHHRRRVELRQVCGLLRPAQRREGPERRGEPGVEHILILPQRRAAALRTAVQVFARHAQRAAVAAGPGRNPVAPPELTRDAPVTDVLHPVVIGFLPALGHKGDLALAHRRNRRLRQRLHLHIPLLAHRQRLYNHARSLRPRRHELVRLLLHQKPQLSQLCQDPLARLKPVEATEPLRHIAVHLRVQVQHRNPRKIVPPARLKVVEVMRRRDLHRTRTELHARSFTICDDWNASVRQRQRNLLAVEMKVARVGRIDRNRRVAQQRLGTRRSHHQPLVTASHGVGDVPQEPVLFLLLHLQIAQHRLARRVPVHEPVILVDETLFPQPHKDLAHSLRQPLVHREPLTRPVQAGTEPTQLHRDPVPILLLPKPRVLEEGLTTHLSTVQAPLLQVTLHHHLRRDTRMVGAR